MHLALSTVAESDLATASLPPVGFGLVTFAILVGLLLLTVAFRNAGNRH